MKIKHVHVARIPEDSDLVEGIIRYCVKKGIKCGSVNVIGALKNAELGFFNKESGEYERKSVNDQCELLSGVGNISNIEEKTFLHLHVVLGKSDFSVTGGHLIHGKVYVAEVIIHEYDGKCPRMKHGALNLWDAER